MNNISLEKLVNFIELRANYDKINKKCVLKKDEVEHSSNFIPVFKKLFSGNSYRLGIDTINDSFFYSFIRILNINTFDSNTVISLKSNLFNVLINDKLYYDYNYKDQKYTIKKFKDYLLTEKTDYFEGCIQLVSDYFKINILVADLVKSDLKMYICSKTKKLDFFKPTICMFLNYHHFDPLLLKTSNKNYFDINDNFVSNLKYLIKNKKVVCNDSFLELSQEFNLIDYQSSEKEESVENSKEESKEESVEKYEEESTENCDEENTEKCFNIENIDKLKLIDLHKIAKTLNISIYSDGKKKKKKDLITEIKNIT